MDGGSLQARECFGDDVSNPKGRNRWILGWTASIPTHFPFPHSKPFKEFPTLSPLQDKDPKSHF